MLQPRPISGRPLSGHVIDGRALGMRGTSSGSASDSLRPLAPVLTLVSDNTVNPPQLDAVFDDTHVWPSGSITGSNFDRIELQVDQDPLFGSVDETDTNDIDAAELLAGAVQLFPGPLATGVALYIRARHSHYVGGVPHSSAWSNIVTETLLGARWLWEDGTDLLLWEDGADHILTEGS